MNTIASYCLFVIAGLVAYVLLIAYCYLNQCYQKWCRKQEARRFHRKKLFRERCQSSRNFYQNYFYELAVNNPRLLAIDLADACVCKMTRKDLLY